MRFRGWITAEVRLYCVWSAIHATVSTPAGISVQSLDSSTSTFFGNRCNRLVQEGSCIFFDSSERLMDTKS